MSANPQLPPPRLKLEGLDLVTHYGLSMLLLVPGAVAVFILLTQHFYPVKMQGLGETCLVTVPAAGLFAWWQRRVLRFHRFATSSDASANYRKVIDAMHKAHWQVQNQNLDSRIVAAVPGTFTRGERVEVRFYATDVLVNSICDPKKAWRATSFGFGENAAHIRYVGQAVADI